MRKLETNKPEKNKIENIGIAPYNLNEIEIEKYFKELERCSKADCDFFLEHNECYDFYKYVLGLREQNEDIISLLKNMLFYSTSANNELSEDDWYRLTACEFDNYIETFKRKLFKYGYIQKDENGDYYID